MRRKTDRVHSKQCVCVCVYVCMCVYVPVMPLEMYRTES